MFSFLFFNFKLWQTPTTRFSQILLEVRLENNKLKHPSKLQLLVTYWSLTRYIYIFSLTNLGHSSMKYPLHKLKSKFSGQEATKIRLPLGNKVPQNISATTRYLPLGDVIY